LSRSLPNCAKAGKLAILREVETQASRPTCRIARICAEPPTRDTELPTLIAGRTPWWKKIALEEDLPSVIEITFVGMYGGEVAGLRLDDRKRCQRAARLGRVQLRRALQQTRVKIEDVARVRFTTRRSPQQQRDFAIRLRVLREVVVHDQRMATAVAEVLTDRAGGVRADVQHRRRIDADAATTMV
jgi:hypothetical protein